MPDNNTSPPDDMRLKEGDDFRFVTEDLGKMQPLVHRLLAAWFILVAVVVVSAIIRILPSGAPPVKSQQQPGQETAARIDTLAKTVSARTTITEAKPAMELDQKYLLVALLFGILGGATHGLASLMDFRGQRRLFRSWSLWYFALPFLGGAIALIFYVVVRAGLLTSGGKDVTESINLYGVAAISAIVGLFTDRATNKLKEVFDTIFATKGKEREGKLSTESKSESNQVKQ
jgi:hypothetical protein